MTRARQLCMDGEYRQASKLLLGVYLSPCAEITYREEALLDLSQIHSYLLNPDRNFDVALGYLATLLEDFPDTELRDDAEKQIEYINDLKSDVDESNR